MSLQQAVGSSHVAIGSQMLSSPIAQSQRGSAKECVPEIHKMNIIDKRPFK